MVPTLTYWARGLILAVAACLLGGCAAQNAYTEGQQLMADGKAAEGVAKLEQAWRLNPTSAPYRLGYLQAKIGYQQQLLERAGRELREGGLADAERDYGLALALDAADGRALTGLRQVDAARRMDKQLKEADAALRANDLDQARAKLKSVLMEQPDHAEGLRLAKRLQASQKTPFSPTEALLASAYRKPVSIEFRDTPLKTVFEVLSRTAGLNFLLDKDVKTDQKTSIFLKGSTIEAAVNLTLLTNQLEQRVLDANTVLIYPGTQAKLKDYQPLTVKSFYLANADAKTVASTIKTILKSRDVIVDEKLNMVIMRDSPEAVRLAEKLVALHDVPDAEVMLEVEIIEVKRSRLRDLGIRWPDQLSLSPLPSASGRNLTVADLRGLNADNIGVTVGSVAINLKRQDTDANILANPRIRVRNKEKAKILIGEKVPNITTTATSTGFVADSVNYVDVGLKLDVEPTIYLDQEVAIKIALEVSSIVSQVQTKSGTLAYQIGTRVAQTVLRLRDGENQVLAGLINDEDRHSTYKVPGLGDVPLMGRLFGSQGDDSTKTEIVLSITPHIIRGVQRPPADILEFESGTETNLAVRVLSGLSTPGNEKSAAPGAASELGGTKTSEAAQPTQDDTAPAAASSGARITWDGPVQGRPGQSVTVTARIDADEALVSLPVAFSFDPAVLEPQRVTEGGFMRQEGGRSGLSSRIDAKGRIYVVLNREGVPARGAGDLVSLTFKVLPEAQGSTQVGVLNAAPVGEAGKAVGLPVPGPFVLSIKP